MDNIFENYFENYLKWLNDYEPQPFQIINEFSEQLYHASNKLIKFNLTQSKKIIYNTDDIYCVINWFINVNQYYEDLIKFKYLEDIYYPVEISTKTTKKTAINSSELKESITNLLQTDELKNKIYYLYRIAKSYDEKS